jgi:hypothetical protein
MKRTVAMVMMVAMVMAAMPGAAMAQGTGRSSAPATPKVETKHYSDGLIVTGLLTTIVGGLIMVPWNLRGENYNIYGDDVCVIDEYHVFDVQDGPCATSTPHLKAGLITMAVGAGLMAVGAVKVKVVPIASKGVTGATFTLTWGGKTR